MATVTLGRVPDRLVVHLVAGDPFGDPPRRQDGPREGEGRTLRRARDAAYGADA